MDPGLKDLDSNARVPFLELNSLVPDFVYQKTVIEDKRPFSSNVALHGKIVGTYKN